MTQDTKTILRELATVEAGLALLIDQQNALLSRLLKNGKIFEQIVDRGV
jgi:hypothetical protein